MNAVQNGARAMLAFHNDPTVQTHYLDRVRAHRAADELVAGKYWNGHRGCAVGCTIHGDDHMAYERELGIPVMLARLEDVIFEHLPAEDRLAWPEAFLSAPRVGADLSKVGWQFLHWLLTDPAVNPGITHPNVAPAIARCAGLLARLARGESVTSTEAATLSAAARAAAWVARAAERAAWAAAEAAAVGATWSAAALAASWVARAAERAAWAAAEAAEATTRAAAALAASWVARAAERAAWAAAEATTWSATWSAAEAATRAAVWRLMAAKLLELMTNAPVETEINRLRDMKDTSK